MRYIDYQFTITFIWRKHDKTQRLYSASSEYPAVFSHQRFSKLASVYYNKEGLIARFSIISFSYDRKLWNLRHRVAAGNQKFSLSTAYANKSVYLLWSQVWAVIIFHENLSIQNIIGIMVVLVGVWMVQRYE